MGRWRMARLQVSRKMEGVLINLLHAFFSVPSVWKTGTNMLSIWLYGHQTLIQDTDYSMLLFNIKGAVFLNMWHQHTCKQITWTLSFSWKASSEIYYTCRAWSQKYHLLLRYMLIFLLTWMSMLYAAKDIKKIIIYINKTHFRLIIRLYNIWNWIINTYFYWICLIHRTLYTCTV